MIHPAVKLGSHPAVVKLLLSQISSSNIIIYSPNIICENLIFISQAAFLPKIGKILNLAIKYGIIMFEYQS